MTQFDMIQACLLYIEDNLTEDLDLEKIAGYFHFSPFYFHRLFSSIIGQPLKQYIQGRKLNKTLLQIKRSDQSFTRIASDLNFTSATSFSRAFKHQFGYRPTQVRQDPILVTSQPMPKVVRRQMKNLNGDIVTDFSLDIQNAFQLSGLVFQVDITTDNYPALFEAKFTSLLSAIGKEGQKIPGYVVYSDCSKDQKQFNVIIGIPIIFSTDLPNFYTISVPTMQTAKFMYSGELYEMDQVLNSDWARFLRISRLAYQEGAIRMIQRFDDIYDLANRYQLIVPIEGNELDQV
ncbi:AraC family transcriptional regulator [Aerococcaceae bacterium 50-4]